MNYGATSAEGAPAGAERAGAGTPVRQSLDGGSRPRQSPEPGLNMLTARGGAGQRARFTRSVNKVVKLQKVTGTLKAAAHDAKDRGDAPPAAATPEKPAAEGRAGGSTPPPEEKEELPTSWKDMSHDLKGVRDIVVEGRNVFIPLVITTVLALVAIASQQSAVVVFTLSFVALLPLAMQLGDLTEMLSGWCGPVAGGLINATLGNATEMVVGVQALRHGLVGIEQGALLGGVLSNMLFVLGLSFLLGGLATGRGQTFDIRTTTADVGVLFIACLGVVLPTAFAVARGPSGQDEAAVLADSRATALILFSMYGAFLAFTLWPMDKSLPPPPAASRSQRGGSVGRAADVETPLLADGKAEKREEEAKAEEGEDDDEDEGPPTVSAVTLVGLLVAVTFLVAVYSNALVTTVFPVSATVGIPADFIAVVLIPIVGNIAELATAVMAARHDKLDLTIAVALGSATQIALFLVPAAVMFGWAIDVPMSLDFAPTFALAFFGAVVAVALLVMDGESHWLKGTLLLGGYGIVAFGMALNNGAAGVGGAPGPGMPPGPPGSSEMASTA